MTPDVATPKPIETVYRGYRFRSRLEARWAVFFDALGVRWEYEKEGYDLSPAGWYLPDFWLPDQECWIEIKPESPSLEEEKKAHALANGTQHTVYVFWGQIPVPFDIANLDAETDSAFAYFPNTPGHDCEAREIGCSACLGGWDNFHKWCECTECGMLGIEFDGRSDRLDCKRLKQCGRSEHGDKGYTVGTPRLTRAYLAARQARFEFGQTPRV
jgi:hypothetical protein